MITLSRTGKPFSLYELPPASRDYDPLPYYFEPYESPIASTELAKEYPLVLTSGRVPFYHHGTLRNIPWLREIYPAPELWIHPTAAGQCGVARRRLGLGGVPAGQDPGHRPGHRGHQPGHGVHGALLEPGEAEHPHPRLAGDEREHAHQGRRPLQRRGGHLYPAGLSGKGHQGGGPPEGVWLKPEDFKPWLPQPTEPTPEVRV